MNRNNLLQIVSQGVELLSKSYASLSGIFNKETNHRLEETIDKQQDSLVIEDFLKGSNNNFTKIVGAALKIAEQKGIVPLKNNSSVDIASMADEACQQVKVAYNVGIGNLDNIEAVDKLADRTSSRASVIIDAVVDKGIDITLDTLGSICPPAKSYTSVVKSIVSIAKPKIKSCIVKGVKSITSFMSSKLTSLLKTTSEKLKNKESQLYN